MLLAVEFIPTGMVKLLGYRFTSMSPESALRVDRRNFESARAELSARRIELEYQDHQIAHSIYLRDPDGHQLEVSTYEL